MKRMLAARTDARRKLQAFVGFVLRAVITLSRISVVNTKVLYGKAGRSRRHRLARRRRMSRRQQR